MFSVLLDGSKSTLAMTWGVLLAALDALKNKMILCGYPEYEAEVQKMMRHLEEAKGGSDTNENDTSRETEQAGTAEISCG